MYDSENKEEITFEDSMRKFTSWITKNLSGIFAFLISMFFIFQGVVEITPTTLEIKEQIIMAFINIFAGFSITSLVGEYGFTSAKNTKKFIDQESKYNESVKGALEFREEIDLLAKDRAKENLKNARIHILESANLYYGDIFNEDSSLKTDFDITKYKEDRQYYTKLRAYNKAVKLRIINTNVFGMASSSSFGIAKEISEKSYRLSKGAKSFIVKVLLGTTSIGVMFAFIGWSWGAIIYAFMQIVLWVGFGLIDRQKNYNFIIEEIVPQIVARRLIIDEFMKKNEEDRKKYSIRLGKNTLQQEKND